MIKLWNQTMPHRCPADAFEPYLTPYFCDGAKTAIVVCAGGAYSERVTYSSFYEFAFLFPSRNCDNIGRVCDNILCIASKYQLSFSFSVGQFYIDFTSA